MSFVEKKILKILKEKNIWFEETEHEPVYTSEQAARVRGLESAKAGVKSMMFKTEAGKFFLVLNPGDKKIDIKKIEELEGAKHLTLAKPEEVEKIAGVPIGCVAPFGLKTELKTYLNEEILQNEFIYFNPGEHMKTIKMRAEDLPKAVGDFIKF